MWEREIPSEVWLFPLNLLHLDHEEAPLDAMFVKQLAGHHQHDVERVMRAGRVSLSRSLSRTSLLGVMTQHV